MKKNDDEKNKEGIRGETSKTGDSQGGGVRQEEIERRGKGQRKRNKIKFVDYCLEF